MKNQLLLPLAILQALWVLQRTPRLPAPQGRAGRIGNGSRNGNGNCNGSEGPLRVVGVGDSIIAGTGVSEQCNSLTATFARLLHERAGRDVTWQVHGANGATSAAVLHTFAPRAATADVYLISVGVNDATRAVQPAAFAENLRGVFELLRRKAPHSVIFYGGLPPLNCFPALPWPLKDILAQRAMELQHTATLTAARFERVLCFEFPATMPAEQFASDGFHPAEVACERWASGLLDLWMAPPVKHSHANARPSRKPAGPRSRASASAHRST